MSDMFNNTADWLEFDKNHLWHPYTSMREPLACYPVKSAKDVHLKLADGAELIDGMSSWWSAVHGYNNPVLNAALVEQSQKMSHVMFGGIAHQPASELGARLLKIMPNVFQHVFLADSGSISVEVALKMALQYWQSLGQKSKNKFLTISGGYHGDPFSCMSVSDPKNAQHHLFPSAIAKHMFAPQPQICFDEPWDKQDIVIFKQQIEQNNNEIAAVIVEPIVQGAGGMRFYHPEYLRQLRKLCDQHNVLLIFDEIATGFGRTGELFAMQHSNVTPDIVCIGKALTGGMMSLAAVLTTSNVAMTVSDGDVPVLMHGPTFMANPLACAVASASIDLLMAQGEGALYPKGWQHNVKNIEIGLQKLNQIAGHHAVKNVRTLGAIGVIEMREPVNVARIQAACIAKGVWVRPFGHLIYIMPPYIISEQQLGALCQAIVDVIKQCHPN